MTEQSQSPLDKLKNSLIGMLVGPLFLIASFGVVYYTSQRKQASEVFRAAVPLEKAASSAGVPAYATGKLSATPVGDPDFVKPGNYLSLSRSVQVRAWVKHEKTPKKDNKPAVYECRLEWVSSPNMNIGREEGCEGKSNVAASNESASFKPNAVTITANGQAVPVNAGALDPVGLPSAKIGASQLTRNLTERSGHFYLDASCASSESVGCERISFSGTEYDSAADYTVFGKFDGGRLDQFISGSGMTGGKFLNVAPGQASAALKAIDASDSTTTKILFAVSVGAFWLGLVLLTGPLLQLISFIPVIGGFGKGLIQFVFAVVAFVVMGLSFLLIEYWYLVLLLVVAVAAFLIYKKKSAPQAA